ncbi:MAG: OmpA family protein, partial [Aquabacterium sp.]
MKKLNKVAVLFAAAALAAPLTAFAQKSIDNWRGVDGTTWKNATGELCWRDNFWTPATASETCDGAVRPAPPPAPAPAPRVAPPPPPPPAPAPAPAP